MNSGGKRATKTGKSGGTAGVSEFWRSSGYRLALVDAAGGLQPSDDLLRAFLLRPEIVPLAESCAAELALHDALHAEPRLAVPEERLAGLADADARHNYRALLAFRDRMLAQPSLQTAYRDLIVRDAAGVPPLFLDQLAHLILRHLLKDCDEPLRLRAAELLFREQKVTIQDHRVMVADEETVEMQTADHGFGSLAGLLAPGEKPPRSIELDVLDEANAQIYWARSDRFDTVLDLGFAGPGLDALCRVLEAWVLHFTGADVSIQPVQQIRDERWVWHIGLDREASALLNDPLRGEDRGRHPTRAAAGAVSPGISRSRCHVAEGAGAPGLSRPRHEPGGAAQAQAAEPASQPAARPQQLIRQGSRR